MGSQTVGHDLVTKQWQPQSKCPKQTMVIQRKHHQIHAEPTALTAKSGGQLLHDAHMVGHHSAPKGGTRVNVKALAVSEHPCHSYSMWSGVSESHRINNFIFINFSLSWWLRIMWPLPSILNFWHSLPAFLLSTWNTFLKPFIYSCARYPNSQPFFGSFPTFSLTC